ncbi:MAG TPA: hypothetical protein VGO43_12140 [Pyrinomonadaceae bacterium]|jgi:hypothetical protein|nr:hypothetical protein [Pyrinomonadaceae bacterium]
MGILDKILGRKPFDPEARRRQLMAHGRITDGVILDAGVNEAGEATVHFLYTLNGVDFEAYEVLTAEQQKQAAKYAPGANVGIRYDTRNQGNAIVE